MGYNYPVRQAYFYSISAANAVGYICPMEMTFKEALKHAMKVRGITSMRQVASGAGMSYDILKNTNQAKSEKPNAKAATKVADFFGVSLSDFYAGNIPPSTGEDPVLVAADVEKVSGITRNLQPSNRDLLKTFAESLFETQEAEQRKK